MKTYSITFATELIAAGVGGLPMSWDKDGDFQFDDSITQTQRNTVLAVAAAHDPNAVKAARDAIKAEEDAAKAVAKADDVVQYLRDHTPAECEAYVQAAVTDLASARQMLKKFAMVLCVLSKQSLR